MTKIDIYSGFLGAGKTTLIKKMLSEHYAGQKVVLIENEFGEIGIDGGFLQEAGVEIREMNSGCICCSLVGDFGKALQQVLTDYAPDRIIIEPSGVGKLSDVVAAVEKVEGAEVAFKTTVADATKVKSYMRNFGEFYNNQIASASAVILSRTAGIAEDKLLKAVELIRSVNPNCTVITTPWEELTGAQLAEAMEGADTVAGFLAQVEEEHHHCGCGHHHDHDHDHHDHECGCGHHHDHDHDHHDHECGCGHHHDHDHHDHDHECGCGHHHDHHDHDHECGCGHHHDHDHHDHDHECGCGHHHDHDHDHHDHDHECGCGHHHDHDHHHHHADEAFTAWGVETAKKFTEEGLRIVLSAFDAQLCGIVLRAKGIVPAADGTWLHFDYVPGEHNIRVGGAAITGKLCVIGAKIDEEKIKTLFGV